ncbi:MAG: hypothetical protein ACO1OT_06450 [Heyndrickxia sp.]
MKRFPFKQSKNMNYDERYFQIDDKICELLKQRKEMELKDGSVPSDDVFAKWSKKYGLYEDYLKAIFSTMELEEFYKPRVEPMTLENIYVFLKHMRKMK